jgi:hypothetical protein
MRAVTEDIGIWRWFVAWLVVGAGFSFGLITLPLLLVPAALAAVVLARHQLAGLGSPGLIAGLGAAPLLIAYTHRGDSGGWSPWPWLAAGVIFLAVGIAWFLGARRSDLRELRSADHAADGTHTATS